jgi:hypothetical protein
MDPARIFTESLTPRPELENSLGQSRHFAVQEDSEPFRHRTTMKSVTDLPLGACYRT